MDTRRLTALSLPILLALAALAVLFQIVEAKPAAQTKFVSASGSSIACSQQFPCPLAVAMILANAGDTIYVGQGTYTSTDPAVVQVSLSITMIGGWDGDSTGQLTIAPDIYKSIIDGQSQRRGFLVTSGITPTIEGFYIVNGNALGQINHCQLPTPAGCGGGMFVDHAAAQVIGNRFITDTAAITSNLALNGYGGGLYVESGDGAVISDNVFVTDSTTLPLVNITGAGGGLTAHGLFTNSFEVANNIFVHTNGFQGGAVALVGLSGVELHDNVLEYDTASQGSCLYVDNATAAIHKNIMAACSGPQTVFLGNFSGAFDANWLLLNPSSATLSVSGGTPVSTNLIFNNIIADNTGAAVQFDASIIDPLTVYLINNTFVGAGSGDGLLADSGYITVTGYNNLISSFSTGVVLSNPVKSSVTMNYTLLDENIATAGNAFYHNTVIGSPDFVAPDLFNFHIGYNSAARDTGHVTIVNVDFDGDHRPLGGGTDIGADETNFNYGTFLPLTRR